MEIYLHPPAFLFIFKISLLAQQFVNSDLGHKYSQVKLLLPDAMCCGPVPLQIRTPSHDSCNVPFHSVQLKYIDV